MANIVEFPFVAIREKGKERKDLLFLNQHQGMASGGASSAPKYKVLSINVMRWNSDSEEPILLDAAYNLADYSFFTRGSVKEFLVCSTHGDEARDGGVPCAGLRG